MENFIVSARKYRPVTFESVVGQKHITSTLLNAISRNQLAHAYLFCGPRGVGKTTCARIFAKAINCQNPAGSEACNECESCRSFNEGRSFAIHELDAASNNSVDDIRSLTEQVRIPPQTGKYSVYIIDEVHMLSSQAFNAFLKTLEEPPAHAVFILATTEKHKIIPTILSRCQIFDFNRIRVEDGVEYLRYIASLENIACDDESLHLISRKADGGMRDALSMFDKAVSFCGTTLVYKNVAETLNVLDYDTYFRITSLILAGDYPTVLTLFDEVLRKGFSGQILVSGLNGHFRDLLMCKDPKTVPLLEVTGTLLEKYREQAGQCETGFLFDAINLLTKIDGTLRTASNQRLNVELGLMKLCGPGQKKNGLNSTGISPEGKTELSLPQIDITGSGTVVAADGQKRSGTATGYTSANKADQGTRPEIGMVQKSDADTSLKTSADEQAPSTGKKIIPETGKRAAVPEVGPTVDNEENKPHPIGDASLTSGLQEETGKHIQPEPELITVMESRASIHKMEQTISGTSIQSILNAPKNIYSTGEMSTPEEDTAEPDIPEDPEAAVKLEKFRKKFLDRLESERPRIAVVFKDMKIVESEIYLSVPTETLREEILRNRSELLSIYTAMAGVTGFVDLKVSVKEDSGPRKPIKVEDRLRFLVERNPMVATLKQALDMDIE